MARLRGEGTATANGRTYRLRFDMNVLADLEDQTGKKPMQIMEDLEKDGGSIATLRQVCHAMLKAGHPEATLQEAGEILSEDVGSVMAVIRGAMPDNTGGGGNARAKAGK